MQFNYNTDAVKICDGIYWIGIPAYKAGFANNPYMIINDDVKAVIDIGSGHEDDFAIVKKKTESIIPIEEINTIMVQHQDPDLCGGIH